MEKRYSSSDKKLAKELQEQFNKIVVACELEDLQKWARPTLKLHAKSESLKKIAPSKWSFIKTDDTQEKAKIEKFFSELEDTLAQTITRPRNYAFLVLQFNMEKGALEVCQEGLNPPKGSVTEEAVRLEIIGVSVVLG